VPGAVAVATFDSVLLMSTISLEMHLVGERAPAKPEMYRDDAGIGIPSGRIRRGTPLIVPAGAPRVS
jgi:hypothetical protein